MLQKTMQYRNVNFNRNCWKCESRSLFSHTLNFWRVIRENQWGKFIDALWFFELHGRKLILKWQIFIGFRNLQKWMEPDTGYGSKNMVRRELIIKFFSCLDRPFSFLFHWIIYYLEIVYIVLSIVTLWESITQ